MFLLLALPIVQQFDDLLLHFLRGLFFPEILFQLCTVDNHFVYLLLFFQHNSINHITVKHAFLVELPHTLCLRERRGRLLRVNGNGDILLIFRCDIGKLHSGSEFYPALVHDL